MGFVVSPVPKGENWGTQILWSDLRHPPAQRDRAAMNEAQLPMAHGDSSGLMTGHLPDQMWGTCLLNNEQIYDLIGFP